MGHMLERMHNVAERDSFPVKRRKVDTPEADKERKAQFGGGGKGGVLGEYMKEKQEEGRKESTANGTGFAVDLTGGEKTRSNIHSARQC
jgi:hypothetical protein